VQVLNPKTLVGAQLVPPVGLAEEWMWGGGSLEAALEATLGKDGALTALQTARFMLVEVFCS